MIHCSITFSPFFPTADKKPQKKKPIVIFIPNDSELLVPTTPIVQEFIGKDLFSAVSSLSKEKLTGLDEVLKYICV
jgi:hypothetical protein